MTATIRSMPDPPVMIDDRYEVYRVILDYEALQDGFLDRIDDLNTTLEQIDMAGNFTKGNAQKLLTRSTGTPVKGRSAPGKRTLGWASLGKMLKGTGLALVLVIDDERFAPIKQQMAQRAKPPRERANASSVKPAWLFTKEKAREMGKKRWSAMSPSERQRLARKAGKASGQARRKVKEASALLTSVQSPPWQDGQSPPKA